MGWEAQGVRFVLYPPPSASMPDVEQVWKATLAPSVPETVQRPKSIGIPQSMAAGDCEGHKTTVTVQPGRIDFFFEGGVNLFEPARTPIEPKVLVARAVHVASACLDNFAAYRVALVLDALQPTNGFAETHVLLVAELPFLQIPKNTRDVNFQINPVIPFAVDSTKNMFRLCRWASAVLQVFNIQLPMAQSPQPSPAMVESRHVISLQADLSSEPSHIGALDTVTAKAMLVEMSGEIGSIVDGGYGHLMK